jgi:hypothetical protein
MEGWTDGRKEGRTDSGVTISLCNFIGEEIIKVVKKSINKFYLIKS